MELNVAGDDSVCWRAITADCVHWWFDCSLMSGQQLCVVSPSSGSLRPGQTVGLLVSVNPEVARTGEKYLEVTNLHLIFFLLRKALISAQWIEPCPLLIFYIYKEILFI